MSEREATPADPTSTTVDEDASAEQARGLFEEHVPMSLIMDLNPPNGPHSQDILDAEGAPEELWWQTV